VYRGIPTGNPLKATPMALMVSLLKESSWEVKTKTFYFIKPQKTIT
jgi:hypothetical protein